MAAFDLQEQEQIAELKAWWAQWGKTVVAAIAGGLIAYFGNIGWRAWQKSQGEAAAGAYLEVQTAFEAKDVKKARAAADEMTSKQPHQALTARAMLLAAKAAFDANDLPGAKSALEWVVANAKEVAVADIARLRLAAVLMDQKQFDAALKTVETPAAEGFAAAFAEARGDALALKGDKAGAKKAYQDALAKQEKDAQNRNVLDIKISGLGA